MRSKVTETTYARLDLGAKVESLLCGTKLLVVILKHLREVIRPV